MSDDPKPSGGRRRSVLVAGALALAVLALYAPVRHFEFLACDDDVNVTANAMVQRGLTLAGARWALVTSHGANWHPLTWLSHMADVELFGLDPGGHHATSALLHAAAAVLLLLALHALTGAFWCSAAVAALFALHPLRIESVAWVAERKDVLSGVFFAATLLAWSAWCRRPTVWCYAAVVALLAAGLASKSMLVTVPLVLLLLDVWPLRRRRSPVRLVVEKLPLFGLAALGALSALWSQGSQGAVAGLGAISLPERVANAVVASVAYLGKLLWPAGLAVFYPHPATFRAADASPFDTGFVACAALLAGLSALAWQQRRRRPYLAVGWLWYLVMLAPVIGLIHIGQQALADRYTYLPAIGIALAVVFALADLVAARPGLRPLAVGLVCLALLGSAWATRSQLAHWRDTPALFEHALAVTERNYFAHNHLGRHYESLGQLERAASEYRASLAIFERDASAHANLANVLISQGRPQAALAQIERAIAIDPGTAKAYNTLGLARELAGEPDLAAAAYQRAIELDPELFSAVYNYSALLIRQGELDAALRQLTRAAALDPRHAEAANNLGVLLTRLDRADEALVQHRRALALAPDRADFRCNFGISLERAGRPGALAVYRQALEAGDPCPPGRRALARHWTRRGEHERALRHYRGWARAQPRSAEARRELGLALLRAGEVERGRSQLETALVLDPEDAAARAALARLERGDGGPAGAGGAP